MSAILVTTPANRVIPLDEIVRLNVDQYRAMETAGILTEEDRVELLDGYLVQKTTLNPPHILVTTLLFQALVRMVPSDWFVNSQIAIDLTTSAPEPDVLVLRGQPRDYAARLAGPADIGLLVEVADSSIDRDQNVKSPIYAAAGIEVYWIVNIQSRWVEVYTQPTVTGAVAQFTQSRIFGETEQVPVVLDGVEVGRIPVVDILPA